MSVIQDALNRLERNLKERIELSERGLVQRFSGRLDRMEDTLHSICDKQDIHAEDITRLDEKVKNLNHEVYTRSRYTPEPTQLVLPSVLMSSTPHNVTPSTGKVMQVDWSQGVTWRALGVGIAVILSIGWGIIEGMQKAKQLMFFLGKGQ